MCVKHFETILQLEKDIEHLELKLAGEIREKEEQIRINGEHEKEIEELKKALELKTRQCDAERKIVR